MSGRLWFCQAIIGQDRDGQDVPCGHAGRSVKVMRPRPSRKHTRICPSCLSEVK